ncbi:MAG: sugar ABC transporter permease [Bacillota bacterium]|nr:MAG: sugar ABC transporter permease [Bacillota bacterium]
MRDGEGSGVSIRSERATPPLTRSGLQRIPKIYVDVRAYTMVVALVLVWLVFTFLTDGRFLTSRNLALLFRQATVTAIAATGIVLVIVAGHIDLSVGSVAALAGGVAAILQVWHGYPTWLVVIVALALATLIGVWQGVWVAYLGVPAFIVTLGGMLVWRGIILLLTDGKSISGMRDDFEAIGQGFISPTWGWILAGLALVAVFGLMLHARVNRQRRGLPVEPVWRTILKALLISALIVSTVVVMNDYEGVPVPMLLLLVMVMTFSVIANYTPFGRHLYAIGGNAEAARLSGINIARTVLGAFTLMGFVSGVAGLVLTARLSGFGSNLGNLLELDAIAAAVIGGTSLSGGEGSVARATIGALVMASIDNGMSLMNTDPFWQYVVKGLMLMVAVLMDMVGKRRRVWRSSEA